MIYDLTPAISASLKVWPGDVPPTREVLREIRQGDHSTLSALHTTVHVGAHADAPSHIAREAPSIDQRPLDFYLGRCQVVAARMPPATRIEPDMLEVSIRAERVLFATGTFPDPNRFNTDFAALSPGLIESLAAAGVKLVGIDTPSVDLFDSPGLPSHHTAVEHDLAILEGLVLADVPAGFYELIALPLRLVHFDASPVRAILRTLA